MIDAVPQDLRLAFRSLRRSPGFTLGAVLTLALGIGANAAIFSVLDAVVLRPLPYQDPDRLVAVWNSWTETPRAAISPLEYFDYREQLRLFEHFGVSAGDAMTLTGSGEPVRIPLGVVSHGVLSALGVAPQLGVCSPSRKTHQTATWSFSSATASGGAASVPTPASSAGVSCWIASPSPSSG